MSRKQLKTTIEYNILEKAIILNDEIGFKKTINLIFDINEVNSSGESLLWTAVSYHRDEMVKSLIKAGADPNISDKSGFPVFHLAVVCEDTILLPLLQKSGANIFSKDGWGNNALSRALHCNGTKSFHIIIYLLRLGLNPEEKNNYGNSARDTAFLIANYDYKPLFMIGNEEFKGEDGYYSSFDEIALVSADILSGAEIIMLRYYEIDKVWEFLSETAPSGRSLKIQSLQSV